MCVYKNFSVPLDVLVCNTLSSRGSGVVYMINSRCFIRRQSIVFLKFLYSAGEFIKGAKAEDGRAPFQFHPAREGWTIPHIKIDWGYNATFVYYTNFAEAHPKE